MEHLETYTGELVDEIESQIDLYLESRPHRPWYRHAPDVEEHAITAVMTDERAEKETQATLRWIGEKNLEVAQEEIISQCIIKRGEEPNQDDSS